MTVNDKFRVVGEVVIWNLSRRTEENINQNKWS